jgi:ribosomal protein S24E
MDIAVKNETRMELIGRTDYTVRIAHEGATKGRAKLRDAIAKQLKGRKELTIIRRIRPAFGSSSSVLEVSVYDSQESLDRFEPEYVKKRHEKGAPAEEAPASEEKGEDA